MFKSLIDFFDSYIIHLFSIDDFMIKSDEEQIDELLKNPSDRILFNKTIDELQRSTIKSKTIILNNKQITINLNMNAQQAREIATRTSTEAELAQYKSIKAIIAVEANKGNFELWYFAQIEQNTITLLEGDGFHVTIDSERQEDYSVKITW